MTEHFQDVVDYVIGNDTSELAKTKAELAYALHALEREIAICAETQNHCDALRKALEKIAYHEPTMSDFPHDVQGMQMLAFSALTDEASSPPERGNG